MSGYLSFFTPFEKYMMKNRISPRSGNRGPLALGDRYTVFCYMLFSLVFIAGFVNVIAEGMHNTKQINKDPAMNIGITCTQIALSGLVVLFSVIVAGMHFSHNSETYINRLNDTYDLHNFVYLANNPNREKITDQVGFKLTYSVFALFVIFVVFCYGFMLLVFSSDRLACTMSASATCDGITKLDATEKAALRLQSTPII